MRFGLVALGAALLLAAASAALLAAGCRGSCEDKLSCGPQAGFPGGSGGAAPPEGARASEVLRSRTHVVPK